MISRWWHTFSVVAAIAVVFVFAACSKDEEPATVKDGVQHITVLFSPNALGDRGYNDNVFEGIYRFKEYYAGSRDVVIKYVVPNSNAEIDEIIQEWFATQSSMRRLLVITTSEIAMRFSDHPDWRPRKNCDVLFLDSDLAIEGIYTRNIFLYGLSHLAGQMTMRLGFDTSAIVLANPIDPQLQDAAHGFMDGFRVAGGTINDADIYYLADQSGMGYDRSDSMFSLAYHLGMKRYKFVFPVCGGSTQGLYNFCRSIFSWRNNISFLTCGLDVDQQDNAIYVLFSLLKRYDLCLENFMNDWVLEKKTSLRQNYGLDSPYAECVIADDFLILFEAAQVEKDLPEMNRRAVEAEQQYMNQ